MRLSATSQPNKPLVLGSTSNYRKALLERLGLPFLVAAPDCDETPKIGEKCATLVERLAETKARSLAKQFPGHLIIGSDQVANLDGSMLCKPGSIENAEAQLASQSGRSVIFMTGLCLLDSASGEFQLDTVQVEVQFRELQADEIRRYVASDMPLDCAGSIKSEGLGVSLLDAVNTSDTTALVGLPLIRLAQMLRSYGVAVP